MKTSQMKSAFGNTRLHGLIAAAILASAFAAAATATCPPGYLDKAGHCVPGPAGSHAPYLMKSSAHTPGIVPMRASKPHLLAPETIDKSKVKPQPGVPIEHHSSASNTHGIIFVGGKQALNPQPIPPGRAIRRLPHPGAPIETGGH